ncbi:Uncharacterized protein APZ42_002264 [Daphnia magna]|uniref:Uncharacterized protein n=1 Tax=Daphnia magna TaxID=35525 RepID=A0A164IE07_9CRUS|nr:Uncharacterized protein APZ42_002264 [Daphnia magna]
MKLDSSPKVITCPSHPSTNTNSQLPLSTSLSTARATRSTKLMKSQMSK